MIVHLLSIQRDKLSRFFFLLFLFFLPTQLGRHFWPFFAFVYGQRIDYLSPTLYLTDLLALLFIFTQPPKFAKKEMLLLASLFFFLSIGIFLSKSPLSGWYMLLKLGEYICLGFSIKQFLQKQTHKILIARVFSIGIVSEALIGIAQSLLQHSLGGFFYFIGERTFSGTTPGIANASLNGSLLLRPYATFSHPNVFAAYLLIAMTLLIGQFFLISHKEKFWYICSLVIGTIGLVLTLSRAAIVIWVLILIFVIIPRLKNTHKLIFLGILVVLMGLFIQSPLIWRFFFTSQDQSVIYRLLLVRKSIALWQAHPIFGIGFGNFLTNLPLLLNPALQVSFLQPVHNIFLLSLAETGIIGFSYFVSLFLFAYRHAISCFSKESLTVRPSIISGIIVLFEVVLLGMVDHYFLTLQQGQLLLVFVFAFLFSL